MSESEELSELIADIYDTAIDPDLWNLVLEKAAHFLDAKSSVLAAHDTARGSGNFSYLWGDDPSYTAHYLEHLAKANPIMVSVHLYCEPGRAFSLSQITSYSEYCQSRLFREWAEPQGWGDFTHVVIDKAGSRFSHFGVAHAVGKSPVDDEPRRKMNLLAPHVTRAVSISRSMELKKLQVETLSAAVNSVAAAVFLIAEDGTIIYANASGASLLDQAQVLRRTKEGKIAAASDEDVPELASAVATLSDETRSEAREMPVIILRGLSSPRFVAHFVSLAEGKRGHAGRLLGASAAIFVHEAELKRPTLVQSVSKRFGLTAAETKVLFTILEAPGISGAAALLGLAEETVRTHLKRVFRKTGTRGQADLVRIIGEIANPMAG
jgi:DNA-binding CsgD family transcriptional regulator